MPIEIHGKSYVEVKDRVIQFRADKPEWSIETNVENIGSNNSIIIKASVYDEKDRCRATGIAHEWQGDTTSMVNKTSWVENCETSAIGRALASLGYGIEEAYASANEIQVAKGKEQKIEKDTICPSDWKEVIVPNTKNKGKKLGELSQKSLQWYVSDWQPYGDNPSQTHKEFRQALDEAKKELFADEADIESIPDEIAEQSADPDLDEDVPF